MLIIRLRGEIALSGPSAASDCVWSVVTVKVDERNFVNAVMLPGLYPESHGIVGNQFYDGDVHSETRSSCKAFFNIDDERSTKHMKWWQKVCLD